MLTALDPTLLAAAIVTVLASMGGMVVMIINARSASQDRREAAMERRILMEKTNATADKADRLIQSTAEIHTLTNSTNTNLQKALDLMTEKTKGLERLIIEMNKSRVAADVVQAAAELERARMTMPPGNHITNHVGGRGEGLADSTAATAKTLHEIEKNTADTAASTSEVVHRLAEAVQAIVPADPTERKP